MSKTNIYKMDEMTESRSKNVADYIEPFLDEDVPELKIKFAKIIEKRQDILTLKSYIASLIVSFTLTIFEVYINGFELNEEEKLKMSNALIEQIKRLCE